MAGSLTHATRHGRESQTHPLARSLPAVCPQPEMVIGPSHSRVEAGSRWRAPPRRLSTRTARVGRRRAAVRSSAMPRKGPAISVGPTTARNGHWTITLSSWREFQVAGTAASVKHPYRAGGEAQGGGAIECDAAQGPHHLGRAYHSQKWSLEQHTLELKRVPGGGRRRVGPPPTARGWGGVKLPVMMHSPTARAQAWGLWGELCEGGWLPASARCPAGPARLDPCCNRCRNPCHARYRCRAHAAWEGSTAMVHRGMEAGCCQLLWATNDKCFQADVQRRAALWDYCATAPRRSQRARGSGRPSRPPVAGTDRRRHVACHMSHPS